MKGKTKNTRRGLSLKHVVLNDLTMVKVLTISV